MCTHTRACMPSGTANLSLYVSSYISKFLSLLSQETSVLAPLQTIMSTKLMTGNVQSQLGQVCWCGCRWQWLQQCWNVLY